MQNREQQVEIWDYYKPRQTHSWNMLVLSWRALESFTLNSETNFEEEYLWENFIMRLWLYRTAINTLTHIEFVKLEAKEIISNFDQCFETDGRNGLQAIRNMLEHFDEYAAGKGRGPATRDNELDPWRKVTNDRFERGKFVFERASAYHAAITLKSSAKVLSDKFVEWYKGFGDSLPIA